jgi:hypothetical protein
MTLAYWLAGAALALALAAPAGAEGFRGGVRDALGPRFDPAPAAREAPRPRGLRRGAATADRIRHWNAIAIDASGLDHAPVGPGETRVFGEQIGPARASRAMAIVHIAIFDAVNAIAGGYRSYSDLPRAPDDASMDAAIAQAAHDTLVAMYPSQRAALDALLAEDLGEIRVRGARAKANGVEVGRRAAAAILARRADDGAQHAEPRVGVDYFPGDRAGEWRQDPISQIPLALGAHWDRVRPFVLRSARQFRAPPPPAMGSREYAAAYDEVKRLGGDGAVTPTVRTERQRMIGVFWAYDGTPSLCAPPRLYNQITVQIAGERRAGPVELARLLALVNVALADAGIAIWESKYHYRLWRPITAIRAADPNDATVSDPTFTPLGAPASNLAGPNFTPPFPAYPSGHAGFGGALFQILRNFYGTDRIAFTFVSDELNGETVDASGQVRPLAPRRFGSLSEAEEENGQSRIYLGIHWSFDKTEGIVQGRRVADHVFRNAFEPVRDRRRER